MSSKKSTTKPVVSTSKFVNAVLKNLNKSEKDLQLEKIQDFQQNAVISAKTQIALIETSELPTLKVQLEGLKNKLAQAQKAFEASKTTLARDFDAYVSNRESALDNVEYAQDNVESKELEIQNAEAKLATFKEILADLS